MKGFTGAIEQIALTNNNFRVVVYTAANCQLVVMSLLPHEDIGREVHQLDQFIRCEQGSGIAVLSGIKHTMTPGSILLIPAGATHNITNTSTTDAMKLSTLYAPPHHRDGVTHPTKAAAKAEKEHFDGITTELT